MTKATRWGVSALMVIGGLSLGAFAGCSDDPPADVPPPEDSGLPDTAKPDTGPGVDAAPVDMGAPDTMPVPADRAVTIVFGAPDLPPKFLCLGAFLATKDPATEMKPLTVQPTSGALGIPDPTAPTDPTKTSAFPYGAVVPVPLNEAAITALGTFKVVIYMVDENPAKMMPAKTCSDMWDTVRTDTKKWKAFDPGVVAKGEHGILTLQGCLGAATPNGACGTTGSNFEFKVQKAAMSKPTEAGANVGLQFLHLSQFGGFVIGTTAVPGFQSADIYIKPGPAPAPGDAGTDGGDGGTTAPALIKVAENVKYNDAITALKGFTLPDGIKNVDSFLIVAPRVNPAGGSFACASTGAPSGTCPNWTLPLAPFFSATRGYQLVGGGLEFPNTNQVIALSGSPIEPLADGGMGTPTLRIPFARAVKWP